MRSDQKAGAVVEGEFTHGGALPKSKVRHYLFVFFFKQKTAYEISA